MIDQAFVQDIALFQNMDEKQVNLICALLQEVNYAAGKIIIEEGMPGESLCMITSGKVKITGSFDENSFVLAELGPHGFFGEMALIDDFVTSATVEAIEDTTLLVLSRTDFKALLATSPELSSNLWEALARDLNRKIRNTGTLVKMYYGLNKALCQDERFRNLYASWNFNLEKE